MMQNKEMTACLAFIALFLVLGCTADGPDNGSCLRDSENECDDTKQGQQSVTISQETRHLMDQIAAVQLYKAQEEVAKFLELAYITLSDHPKQATEVRMTAHAARTQHTMTSGLMKSFMMTAGHIVNTIIPMFLEAIELKDPDMVQDLFNKILAIADDMKREAEDTKARYREIHYKVQENFASVNERNQEVSIKRKALESEKEREEQEARAAKEEEKELKMLQEEMEDEIQELRENRNLWRTEAAYARQDADDGDFQLFDLPFGAANAFTAGGLQAGLTALQFGANIFKQLYKSYKQGGKEERIMAAYKESQDNLDRVTEKKREIRKKRNEKHLEKLRRLSKIKEIITSQVGLGDAESLREVTVYLGRVDTLFQEIITYWEQMANVVKVIREDSNVGDVYIRKMENAAYAKKLKARLEYTENHWKLFGRVCKEYASHTDSEISHLYSFLTTPIDSMPDKEKSQRQQKLFDEIEQEINDQLEDDVD